jgi:putative transcriptional regulator
VRDDHLVDPQSLKSRLLVANPAMPDPNFHRTVVLVLEHSPEGALGLVLNRPSDTEVGGALPEWGRLAVEPPVVFVGGPVEPTAAICLAELDEEQEGERWRPLVGELGTLDLTAEEADLAGRVRGLRVFAGYAGWSAGQVEGELEVSAWFVVDAEPGDALGPRPGDLWHDVLRRQGGWLASLAAYPDDPSTN